MRLALQTIQEKIERGIYTVPRPVLMPNGRNMTSQFEIEASHIYVKFTPENENDIAVLKTDSTLVLSDYPLDYEFPDSFFANRTVPAGHIPEYYSMVPVGQSIDYGIAYQELGELYLPEVDPFFNQFEDPPLTRETVISNEEDMLHHLLYEAYDAVGRLPEIIEDGGTISTNDGTEGRFLIFGRRWRPKGTLMIWDDFAGTTPAGDYCYYGQTGVDYSGCYDDDGTFLDCPEYTYGEICEPIDGEITGAFVPLKGAQVLMRQLGFTVDQGITDANGYYSTGQVRGRARYVIQWERYHYSIRDGLILQAELRGPRLKEQDWNRNIQGGEDEYHGMIHSAAHRYYYGNRMGTTSPPRNASFKKQMKIAAQEIDGTSFHAPEIGEIAGIFYPPAYALVPQIFLRSYGEPSDEVYGTTIHELAHAAHRELDLLSYEEMVLQGWILNGGVDNPSATAHRRARRLLETWAATVEIAFTRDRYVNEFGQSNYQYEGNNFQNRTITGSPFYTSGGWDLIDNVNQRTIFGNSQLPIDNVSGYTLSQLEESLDGEQTWLQWKNSIRDDHNNSTENFLNQLFNNWQD